MSKIFFEGKDKDQYELSLMITDESTIDTVLDQLNLGQVKFIKKDDFKDGDKMTIDVMHPDDENLKIGELTCRDIFK